MSTLKLDLTLEGVFALHAALELPPGVTVIAGPSGSGKSTLLAMIAGIRSATRSNVTLGSEIWDSNSIHIAPEARGVGMLMQDALLFPHLSVAENILFACPPRDFLPLARECRIDRLLEKKVSQLSGGEAQRVAFIRALIRQPRVILLDEPFSHVDAELRAIMIPIIARQTVPTLVALHESEAAFANTLHIANGAIS